MKRKDAKLEGMGSVKLAVWGEASDKVYLFVHGKMGNKEEAKAFAEMVGEQGWQVASFDLPEHGQRKEVQGFNPWVVIPELQAVMAYVKKHWKTVGLRANSLGAWFSMLSFADVELEKCLLVSPVLDMEKLIRTMMQWAGVTEERLCQEQEISTEFGEVLSYKYLLYAKEHPIKIWKSPTAILYGDQDNLTDRSTVESFTKEFSCRLEIMENGEHWFHTPEQLAVLQAWTHREI